jgi:PAS domain S-box-containing protein
MTRPSLKDLPRFAHGLAGATLAVLSLLPALVYLALAYQFHAAAVETEVDINARLLTQIVNSNPEMWRYERLRLEGILSRRPRDGYVETRLIRDKRGAVMFERGGDLQAPVITRSRPLHDSGFPVGQLEISRSLRPVAVRTAALSLAGLAFGTIVFLLLRAFPLIVVQDALESLSLEVGRSKVTLGSIRDGVVTTDTAGKVVFVNKAAEAILGWSQAEARSRPIAEVYPVPGLEGGVPCAAGPRSEFEAGPGRRRTLTLRDGTERLIDETASPIIGRHGRYVGCVLVLRDVTEKVRLEEELMRVQKLDSLGILAGGIAHEIRNPLSGVNIYLSALERLYLQSEGLTPEEKERAEAITGRIRAASEKMAVIVKRVMEFARPSPSLFDRIDLNRSIEEAVLLTAPTLRHDGIALEKSLHPGLPQCLADSRLVLQVLLNLILNASQALRGISEAKRIAVASFPEEGQVVVTVSDSGPGVPEPLRERIFDPFFTTKKEGSGIGLAFSRRVALEHGGTLVVARSRWGGAEFRLELPAGWDPKSCNLEVEQDHPPESPGPPGVPAGRTL